MMGLHSEVGGQTQDPTPMLPASPETEDRCNALPVLAATGLAPPVLPVVQLPGPP